MTRNKWRLAVWSAAALLWLLPLLAMRVTEQVNWGALDFAVSGALLLGVGLACEVTVRMTSNSAYRFAVGVALAAAFLLIWLSLSVGVIGRDGDPANLMYFGVLAVGAIGMLMARFRPRGMARALLATALAQSLVAAIALIARLGYPWSGPLELVVLNGFFVALFVVSALLFLRAAHRQPEHNAT